MLWLKKSEQLRQGLNQAISYEKICALRSSHGCIERQCLFLKQQLKNEFFSGLQALRTRIQKLFDQLTLVQAISVSSYNFILLNALIKALFYAASD